MTRYIIMKILARFDTWLQSAFNFNPTEDRVLCFINYNNRKEIKNLIMKKELHFEFGTRRSSFVRAYKKGKIWNIYGHILSKILQLTPTRFFNNEALWIIG